MSDATILEAEPAPAPGPDTTVIVGLHDRPYIDWAAVIGGAFVGLGLWLLLTSFGASIGLLLAPPWGSMEGAATTLTLAGAAWFAIVQLFSTASGAYLAGRMRHRTAGGPPDEIAFRDGTNGLLVWAVGLFCAAIIAITGFVGATAAVSTMPEQSRPTAGIETLTDQLFRPKLAASEQTADDAEAGSQTIAILPARRREPLDRDEVARIIERSTQSQNATAASDREYLAALVAARTNLDADEAEARVNTVIAQRKETLEKARTAGALLGFWTAVALLISGAASWWAGAIGGRHRDDLT